MKGSILFQIIWTVVAFVFFIGVIVWAWSKRRKTDFEDAANLALDDDAIDKKETLARKGTGSKEKE